MKHIIILEIKNVQEEYALALKFIEDMKNRKEIEDIPNFYKGYVVSDLGFTSCAKLVERALPNYKNPNDIVDEKLLYCFKIRVQKEDDIVNLMYFYLIKQQFENVFAILDTVGIEYDMKISSYLSFEMNKNPELVLIKTNKEQIEKFGVVHRLAGSSKKNWQDKVLTKFLPLIEVNEDTYYVLLNTVKNAKVNNEEWVKNILRICEGLFTRYYAKESRTFYGLKEVEEEINNTSVLTYILFCSFRSHCSDRRTVFDIDKMKQELSDARDISEGILQILENIVQHSQNKKGYFSFRIHDKDKSEYLKKEYAGYLEEYSTETNNTFLEVFIADAFMGSGKECNDNILCNKFIENLRERSLKDERLIPFIQRYQGIEVKQFFNNDIWTEYNQLSDNIIEHYGLQLFDKIVSSYDGCFELISTMGYRYIENQIYSSAKVNMKSQHVLPGTQYRVLIPIKEKIIKQDFVGINFSEYTQIEMLKPIEEHFYSKDVNLSEHIKKIRMELINKFNVKEISKQQLIPALSEYIYLNMRDAIEMNPQYIIQFFVDGVKGVGLIEIIFKATMKAIIRLREEIGNTKKVYLVFGMLSNEFITEFCYLMAIYYYKSEKSKIMANTEMYLWDTNFCNDLLLSGGNIHTIYDAIMERAVQRGIYPRWLKFINYVWKKYDNTDVNSLKEDRLTTLPYDVLVRKDDKTIFEHVVLNVLNKSMEENELGCLLDNTHIQLDSKIHITRFYNGKVLFLNNYFTNYFAYLIFEKIVYGLENRDSNLKNIVLVGYESYSETLLVKANELLKEYINKHFKNSYEVLPYIIGEVLEKKVELRSEVGRFGSKNVPVFDAYKDSQFVFIIPINSTLRTFDRVHTELERVLGTKINQKNNLANYALILSRDNYLKERKEHEDVANIMTDLEREYWDSKFGHTIITKDQKLEILYFIEVCGKWEKPCNCKLCFPEKSVFEKPLIKTDVTGLSPLAQLGEKRKWRKDNNLSRENMDRLKKLTDVLSYNHIERSGNHYLYYFDTSTYFYNNQNQIIQWLKEINKDVTNIRSYNFIVSPLHDSNAGFTETVSKVLFNNTAHIIRLDFGKTYRSNFMQFYSYLQILYRNLLQSPVIEKVEINFYFVDDEVISGKTIMRAKSLIEGLFLKLPQEDYIKINVFKRIIVLINRLSDNTKHNYINNIDAFNSYVDFNISVIQNHDDFCFMCKLVDRANGYKFMSTTNAMDAAWGEIEKKFSVKNYVTIEDKVEYKQEKYKQRMLAAHYAEAEMWCLSENAQVGEYFSVIVKTLFYKRLSKNNKGINLSSHNKEVFISFVKTLSRPFFVYRNRAKEAALHILITFTDSFLGLEFEKLWERLKSIEELKNITIKYEMERICRFITDWRNQLDVSAYGLLMDFIEQLADMESAYIIRYENIVRILETYDQIAYNRFKDNKKKLAEERYRFELEYVLFIKQIINLDDAQTKSLWVEKLLLCGREIKSQEDSSPKFFINLAGYRSRFGRNILIENTKIVYEGIKYLADIIENKIKDNYEAIIRDKNSEISMIQDEIVNDVKECFANKDNLHLCYFKEILMLYQLENAYEKIGMGVLYYVLMFKMNAEDIEFGLFYRRLYEIICGLTRANVQLLMIPEIEDDLIYSSEPCVIHDKNVEANRFRVYKLADMPLLGSDELRNLKYDFDTYYIYNDMKKVVIKYRINLKHKKKEDNIYMIIDYAQKKKIKDILFDIRFILLCRSRTITRMKRDFNNNLFESLWQEKRHKILLEHFKNVSHVDPDEKNDISKKINLISKIDNYPIIENLQVYKAFSLKLLADNNISSIYHQVLIKRPIGEYVYTQKFTAGNILENVNIFKYVLGKGMDYLVNNIKDEDIQPNILINKDVLNSDIYYLAPKAYSSILLVISLIQNAYKHGNNSKDIEISKEAGEKIGKSSLDYLCISNGVDVENISIIRERIKMHIRRPSAYRKKENNVKSEGITLYSLNQYCNEIIKILSEENEVTIKQSKKPKLKYEIKNEQIIFKIPILKGEKESETNHN